MEHLTRERLLTVVLATATALSLYVCYYLVRPFLAPLAWALALAVTTYPMHDWIARRVRYRSLAAGVSVLIVVIALLSPLVLMMHQLVGEIADGISKLQAARGDEGWRQTLDRAPILAGALDWIESQINWRAELEKVRQFLISRLSALVTLSLRVVTHIFITAFVLFYFFRDRRAALDTLLSLMPLSAEEAESLFRRIRKTIHATLFGTLAVGMAQGTLGGLMFWVLGLPAPIFWGAIMVIMAVVPIVGAFAIWIPASLYLLLEGDWVRAAILFGWGALVVSLVDNFLYPILVGRGLQMHTLPVFFALLGGLFVFGASGLIIGPVALAVTLALLDVWRMRAAAIDRVGSGEQSSPATPGR